MTINASDQDGLTIDQELAVFDFNVSKPDLQSSAFQHSAQGVLQGDFQIVKVRVFTRPGINLFEGL